jgi:hypothetical protein
LVARIDTPVLNFFLMVLFFPGLVFHIPHLGQFIGRAKELKPSMAVVELRIDNRTVQLNLHQPRGSMILRLTCRRVDLLALLVVCGPVSHLFSLVEQLDLNSTRPVEGSIPSTQFLDFFRPFTATRSLDVSSGVVPSIASALQELIGARATEVLPNLRDLSLEVSAKIGSIQEVIQPFVDARRLSGQPIAVHYLDERE